MEKKIQVTVKNVYGNEVTYPACDASKAFAKLVGQKTLTDKNLRLIREELGYKIEFVLDPNFRPGNYGR